jgi:hypothetical protein
MSLTPMAIASNLFTRVGSTKHKDAVDLSGFERVLKFSPTASQHRRLSLRLALCQVKN